MRNRAIIAILLAGVIAVPAFAETGPPWQVRPYLSTYTDATWTWNYTALRHRFVCPYCGYSTNVPDPTPADADYTCPNPFAVAAHPAVQLVEATPHQRVLGHLAVGALPFGATDVENPLVGRPFHPGGTIPPAWNANPSPWEQPALPNQASWLTLRAGNLDIAGGGAPLVADGDALRFMVLDPGSVRASARFQYVAVDTTSGAETPTAAASYYAMSATPGVEADQYRIHVNPYRVSDGDVFYIRHSETTNAAGITSGVNVEVYSTLYGNDFSLAGQFDPDNEADDYAAEGLVCITDSGALRIGVPRQFTTADMQGTFVLKIVIHSNTHLLPGPAEVNWDLVDGVDLYPGATEVEPNLTADIAADLSTKKAPYVIYGAANRPALATANSTDGVNYNVEEKVLRGGAFASSEIWPYRIPPQAAGRGRVMLQWAALPSTPPGFTKIAPPGEPITYCREGLEWHYLANLNDFSSRLITNPQVANMVDVNALAPNTYLDAYFMVSRLDVDHDPGFKEYLGDDQWVNSLGTDRGPAATDTEPATGGLARIILGQLTGPTVVGGGWGGEYKPGARTPARLFSIANRLSVRPLVCRRGCGARYILGQPYADGNDGQLGPGDDCPACGRNLTAERGEADARYDVHGAVTAATGARLTPEAFRFEPHALVPIAAHDFEQRIYAEIPAYQPPSVPAGATHVANNIEADLGYRGTMVSFDRPEDDGSQQAPNTNWDAYYLSPENRNKLVSPVAAAAGDAEWICPVCHMHERRGANTCRFCGHTFVQPNDLPDPYVPHEALTAEEYDLFGVQLSVLREADLAAERRVVDLGWIAPGTPADAPNTVSGAADVVAGSQALPTDVSTAAEVPVRNEGNIALNTDMPLGVLLRTGVEQSVRSRPRWAQSVPITLGTIFRYRPGMAEFGTVGWLLGSADATSAAGADATAMLRAGLRSGPADPYPSITKPVPLGQPVGNYASELLVFVDLNGDGVLNFYDTQTGRSDRPLEEFDPGIDEPFEPVAPFVTRARVVESRLPQNDFYSADMTPTLLYQEDPANPASSRMQVLWVGQRAVTAAGADAPAGVSPADVPLPIAPLNILYANAQVNATAAAVNDPLYRGWLWAAPGSEPEEAAALSASLDANELNSSPTAYLDPNTGDRWAMWHRSMTSAAGVSSQLRFDTSAGTEWDGSDPTEFIFGSSGTHSGLTGFVRDGAANMHWLLWHAGPVGREHLRYRWEWDPTSATVPGDERLMVSNSSTGQRLDYFEVDDVRYRKPALDPFTYVKEASTFGTTNATGEFQLDVLYTGHIRSLGNSDICWSRFNFGIPADADFPYNSAQDNFGKVTFPRVAGQTYGTAPFSPTDARGMAAVIDAAGDVRGYVGEQLEPSPRREAFQAHDIDWLVTYDFETEPDWFDWMSAAAPKPVTTEYDDPMFYVGVVTDDGTGPRQRLLAVEWSQGSYNPSTGLYQVLPRFVEMDPVSGGLLELPDPADPATDPALVHPNDDSLGSAIYRRPVGGVSARALLAPRARQEAMDGAAPERLPAVTLEISPASGLLRWSSSLFNPDNPLDSGAVFNDQNTPNIVDVVVYADYTPFVRRATTDAADDDSPSAFWNAGDSGRLTLFWRRSYADTDTPHFGRPSFLHKTYTRAIQVGRPAINTIVSVVDRTVDPDPAAPEVNLPYSLVSANNGVIDVEANPATALSRIGHRVEVTYTDAAGIKRTENHRVVGWSLETPVPINAVTNEGPVRVIPEIYTVSAGGEEFDTVRYWLVWASSRGVYDMRAAGSDGQRVQQSADVYLAVVAPDHSSLIADLEVPQLEP